MGAGVVGRGSIELPTTQDGLYEPIGILEERDLPDIVEAQRVAHVKDGISAIQSRHGRVEGVALAGPSVVRTGGAAVPCGSIVDGMAIGVVERSLNAVG